MKAKEFIEKYSKANITHRNEGHNRDSINEDAFSKNLRYHSVNFNIDEDSIVINWIASEYPDHPSDIDGLTDEIEEYFSSMAKKENLEEQVVIVVNVSYKYAEDDSDDYYCTITVGEKD